MVASDLLYDLSSVVLESDEIANEVEKTGFLEDPAEQGDQLQRFSAGDCLAVHGAPGAKRSHAEPMVPTRAWMPSEATSSSLQVKAEL